MRSRLITAAAALIMLAAPMGAAAQSFRPQVEPTVKEIRAQYPPQVMPEQVGEMLNAIAWQHRPNLKLLKKGGGGRCPSPLGVEISCDILIWAPPGTPASATVHVDVFSGASGNGGLVVASPRFESHGPCTKRPDSGCEMKNAIDPIAPVVTEPTDPPPPPPPPVGDVAELLKALRLQLTEIAGRFDIYNMRDVMNTLAEIVTKQTDTQRQLDGLAEQVRTLKITQCFVARSKVLGEITLCPSDK